MVYVSSKSVSKAVCILGIDMPDGAFPSTRHSVLSRVTNSDEGVRRSAVSAIVETYWKPAYKYIRLKWKASPDEAQDLTQEFFASLLGRDLLARYDPAKASFRTYIRTCIDGMVSNERKASVRVKRGGERRILSLDFAGAEIEVAAAEDLPADEVFYREWQRQMFALAILDLKQSCESAGRMARYGVFERYDLAAGAHPSYEDLAVEFQIPVTTVTNHLAWARRELRRLLLDRLSAMTANESELRREANRLFQRR